VVDVAGLYHNPPEKAVVLCVDEKSARSRRWKAGRVNVSESSMTPRH
jgi:hypothetical protein